MSSSQNVLSCVPCAKRKVRCDRLMPCSHCKRRTKDVCEYPISVGSAQDSWQLALNHQRQGERLEKLEQYIRRLGHDPEQVARQIGSTDTDSTARGSRDTFVTGGHSAEQNTKRKRQGSQISLPESRNIQRARLVEHDEQTTYIEMPMWYSWKEAKRPSKEFSEHPSKTHKILQSKCTTSANRYNTLLDPTEVKGEELLQHKHPSSQQIHDLWHRYLSNVHPLTMLFFHWDKWPILERAAYHTGELSKAEHAFSFSVYLMTVVTLSDADCNAVMGDVSKTQLLDDLQETAETALLASGFIATTDLLVLQAQIIYLLAIRDRSKPAAWFSLMGVAFRTAQRLGLHRDGEFLGLPALEAEEKRRVWWQMQHMDIMIAQLLGCLPMTLHADWDTKLPGNIDDDDVQPGMETLPSDRKGLTSMSHCLWRYYILYMQRVPRDLGQPREDFGWLVSPHTTTAIKMAFVDKMAATLSERYVQHCDLLNPLHVSIQIGVRSFILAMRRVVYQPSVANAKISEMAMAQRDDLLKVCMQGLEYMVLSQTTKSIAQWRWHSESLFSWPAFVYVIIEANYRATCADTSSLWDLIDQVWRSHSKLTASPEKPEVKGAGRLILLAWRKRRDHLQMLHQVVERPWSVATLEEDLSAPADSADPGESRSTFDTDEASPLDFDLIDWAAWEQSGYADLCT